MTHDARHASVSAAGSAGARGERRTIRVLLVDDDPADAELTRIALKDVSSYKFQARHAASLAAALEELRAGQFDVILLDLGLPESVDLETLARVRRQDQTTPIVVLTGLADEEKALRSLNRGAQDYLIKGDVSPNILSRSIRHSIQRQQLLEELAESRRTAADAKFRRLLESAPDAMVIADSDGRITLANQQVERLFGYTQRELIGRPVEILIPERFRREHRRRRDAFFAQPAVRAMGSGSELLALRRDGSEFPIEVSLSPLETEEGTLVSAAIRDVSQRKRAERELRTVEEQFRQAQKMEAVGRLAGGVAHDFNNLLTVILGFSELLLDKSPADEEIRELLEGIHESGDRAAALTRQLLLFSRKAPAQEREVDVNQMLKPLAKLLRPLIGEDIEFNMPLDPEAGSVQADPGQLEQVIMNLAVNARDAMPQGGKLEIRTRRCSEGPIFKDVRETPTSGWVVLSVSDTGCGMDAATQSRIFEPFFTTKAPGEGTGLGLATAYGIVERAGGCIRVHSELGRGTEFTIYLPRMSAQRESSRTASGYLQAAGGSERILLVEDEARLRGFTRRVLKQSGYAVLEAPDGLTALEVLKREGSVDLLLTDVVMPQISGPELAERALAVQADLRVLYMSGYSEGETLDRALSGGGPALLQKPFTRDGLLAAVDAALETQESSAGGNPVAC